MKTSLDIFKIVLLYLLVSCSCTLISRSVCSAGSPDYIPEDLKPWIRWVLHDKTRSLECIPHFNDPDNIQCAWPTSINLDLDSKGGTFVQQWRIYHETYIPLPGSGANRPRNVMVKNNDNVITNIFDGLTAKDGDMLNGVPAVVVSQAASFFKTDSGKYADSSQSVPSVRLQPGYYTITGSFSWSRQPEYIQIPSESALVNLVMDGRKVEFPNLDDTGRLWLKTLHVEQKEENRLKVESFRLIDDSIPPQATLHATLDISGSPREVTLGPLYSPLEFIPLSLNTDLPSKLESDGRMRIQVKPGRYSFTLAMRHTGHLEELGFKPSDDGYWPQQEIWSVVRHPDLRVIEISGVTPIDPQMTSLPEEWKSWPAHVVMAGEAMKFKELKRGDPSPSPDQLNLERTLWLAFDGTGYTVQDKITGRKNSDWRMDMEQTMIPGRITVDGVEQLITRQDSSLAAGVEVRSGKLNLIADSTLEGPVYKIGATGWKHSFQKVSGRLNLPPGWKLIAATGVDNIPGTWIKRWSLLDIFILLIFTIATARIFSTGLAVAGFITMALLYHEPGAPRYVWLFLLAGFAMLKLARGSSGTDSSGMDASETGTSETGGSETVRSGKFGKAVRTYQFAVVIILLLVSVPYAIRSLRVGIYPQLEQRWVSMNHSIQNAGMIPNKEKAGSGMMGANMMEPESPLPSEDNFNIAESEPDSLEQQAQLEKQNMGMVQKYEKQAKRRLEDMAVKGLSPMSYSRYDKDKSQYQTRVMQYDPKSLTQTGPGLPLWQPFRTISFSWSGPVEPGQSVSFFLTGPGVNLMLAFLRVGLIILLAFGMFRGAGYGGRLSSRISTVSSAAGSVLILLSATLLTISNPSSTNAGEIPSPEILAQLEQRLLEKDKCFPSCADISSMLISIDPENLELELDVDAAIDTAIPLPGQSRHWLPASVLINGKNPEALFRSGQHLWIMVPTGKNIVVAKGRVGNQNSFQLPMAMKPHSGKVNAAGWDVQGIRPDASMDDQLQFRRIAGESEDQMQILETGLLPPFALVERTVLLGLDWKVETTVRRMTPSGSAIVLNLPLLEGESVVTEGIRVKNGVARVTLNSTADSITFESFLESSDTIRLYHALSGDNKKNLEWTEIWKLDASPVFHVETQGIPVIMHKNQDRWYPAWHPWPGEEVILKISRPKGVGGQTLTIEKSFLELHPGQRSSRALLRLSIKSSQGGQHTIKIPQGAQLQELKINGSVQLIRQEGQNVVLPISPGSQNIELAWRDDKGIESFYSTPVVDLGMPSVNAAVDLHISSDRWPLFVGGEQLSGPAVLFWSVLIVVIVVSAGLAMSGLAPLRFYQWFLLGIGMSMSNSFACIFVVAWLVVLERRKKWGENLKVTDQSKGLTPFRFNLMQICIAALTFIALVSLLFAVSRGLLGHPAMNITGNGSTGRLLRWYHDMSDLTLPVAWLFSLPMTAYRAAMLAWALWLSFWLVSVIKWGWSRFSTPVVWKSASAAPEKKRSGFSIKNIFRSAGSEQNRADTATAIKRDSL
ncbi:MAG: hypothetical protein HQK61_01430 [Desulfamplus sp.]|nr:hypothetical protein [Desulfamplus sp.]